MEKKFSKELWLVSANEDKADGILTQQEIDDALKIWVNACDGKTESELKEQQLNKEWFR